MKRFLLLAFFGGLFHCACSISYAAEGIPSFYGDPPDEHHPWAVHDPNRPQPPVVTPGSFSSADQVGKPPSDAIVLFDGKDLSHWESTKNGSGPAKWVIKDGVMEVAPGTGEVRTKDEFGDCQLHIEWAEPANVSGSSQGRGNSGIFLMGRIEIQVLDSYHNITYADGHAAAVYGVNPPMANAVRPPGEFQVYDIVFRQPIFRDGQEVDPGYVTVFVNGVLAQDCTRLEGPTGHMKRTHPRPFPEKGPLSLQDHGNPVRFRNIWYRPLAPRPVEGGTDEYLTTEAAMAKRKEIAGTIRQDAAGKTGVSQMLRLMESLEYENDPATFQKVDQLAKGYVQELKGLSPEQLNGRKDEVRHVNGAFQYLAKFKLIPADLEPKNDLQQIVREKRWDR